MLLIWLRDGRLIEADVVSATLREAFDGPAPYVIDVRAGEKEVTLVKAHIVAWEER